VFIDDKYAGDYDAMVTLNEAGQLDKLLQTMKHALIRVSSMTHIYCYWSFACLLLCVVHQ
jgi:hypothetical protein